MCAPVLIVTKGWWLGTYNWGLSCLSAVLSNLARCFGCVYWLLQQWSCLCSSWAELAVLDRTHSHSLSSRYLYFFFWGNVDNVWRQECICKGQAHSMPWHIEFVAVSVGSDVVDLPDAACTGAFHSEQLPPAYKECVIYHIWLTNINIAFLIIETLDWIKIVSFAQGNGLRLGTWQSSSKKYVN